MERMIKLVATGLGTAVLTAASLAFGGAALADTTVEADNSCTNCNAQSGDSSAQNSSNSFTGQQSSGAGTNYQEGDNNTSGAQNANSQSGDAMAGQAIGVAGGSGDTHIVARNRGENINVGSGNSNAQNNSVSFTGQLAGPGGLNVQFGDNTRNITQTSNSSSGDAVAGQVIGII